MKEKFRLFWKDYFDLCGQSTAFYKKHWLGMIIYTVVVYGFGCALCMIPDLIQSRKEKKEYEALKKDLENGKQEAFDFTWTSI